MVQGRLSIRLLGLGLAHKDDGLERPATGARHYDPMLHTLPHDERVNARPTVEEGSQGGRTQSACTSCRWWRGVKRLGERKWNARAGAWQRTLRNAVASRRRPDSGGAPGHRGQHRPAGGCSRWSKEGTAGIVYAPSIAAQDCGEIGDCSRNATVCTVHRSPLGMPRTCSGVDHSGI